MRRHRPASPRDANLLHRCTQVLECLKAEEAPLALWLDFVKAYLAAGHTQHAEKMLREGTSAEVTPLFCRSPGAETYRAWSKASLGCSAGALSNSVSRMAAGGRQYCKRGQWAVSRATRCS